MDAIGRRGGTPDEASEVEVALLDLDGVIVSANQAWYDFCLDNGGDIARCGVGTSYLDACAAAGTDVAAPGVLDAIRSALGGQLVAPITLQIPCDTPDQPRWFDLLVSSRTDPEGQCIGATVTLSLSQPSRKPIDRPDAPPPAAVEYPDRPRLAMEGLVAELAERVQEVLTAQARLHALLRATAALAAESDLSALLALITSLGRELIGAHTATLVPTSPDSNEAVAPAEAGGTGSLTALIVVNGSPYATLAFDASRNGEFTSEDQWLANELAASAGWAIRNALSSADRDRNTR